MKLARNVVTSFCCWLASCAAALAQPGDLEPASGATLAAVEPVLAVRVESSPAAAWSGHGEAAVAGETDAIDYRVWVGAGRASIGVGVAGTVPSPGTPLAFASLRPLSAQPATSMIVGLRYQVTDRSRLYVDTASLGAARLQPDADVRMGVEFKSARSNALSLARGTLFRVQWSSRSQVSLRLRSGGLRVVLRSEF